MFRSRAGPGLTTTTGHLLAQQVTIGVDPHKASHTAAGLDEHGQLLGQQRLPATLDGYRLLHQWAGRWPQRRWAVEAPTASAARWPSGWSATASRWWTCRPS